MGFLKRIFSRRSSKKTSENANHARPAISHPFPHATISSPQLGIIDEDGEAAASRLLRSSSARFAVMNEVDYSSLPPLPHPINNVVMSPGASTASLASTATSINRGSYSVRITGRHKHSTSRSSTAPSEIEKYQNDDKEEDGQLLRLRSDPSVASLLDLYDSHGRLPANAFHDSPTKEQDGRAQVKRTGSTLRQLLGAPDMDNSGSMEGDISWAERFLGESDVTSNVSSLDLTRPTAGLATNIHLQQHNPSTESNDATFSSNDNSTNTDDDLPGISSLEVEISSDMDMTQMIEELTPVKPRPLSQQTPRRASEVFKFLKDSDKEQESLSTTAKELKDIEERSLPDLPGSAFSSPSSDTHGSTANSDDDHSEISDTPKTPTSPAIPIPHTNDTHEEGVLVRDNKTSSSTTDLFSAEIKPRSSFEETTRHIPRPSTPPSTPNSFQTRNTKRYTADSFANTSLAIEAKEGGAKLHQAQKVRVIMTAPTTVIVTAPTPNSDGISTPATRIPRGPRGQPKRAPGTIPRHEQRPMLVERSNSGNYAKDRYTAIPLPKKKKSHSRTPSYGSATSSIADSEISGPMKLVSSSKLPRRNSVGKRSSGTDFGDKENALYARQELPSTPLRSHSLARIAVTPELFRPPAGTPSPASETEKALSPVGRRLMSGVREQRMKAREVDKAKSQKEGKRRSKAMAAVGYFV